LRDKKRSIGLSFAWNGLLEVIKTERNFQIHLFSALTVILASMLLSLSQMEWIIIVLVIGFVFVAEIINSAIERIIDYLRPEIHPAAKVIKDIAAANVLVASFIATVVGFLLYIPKILALFKVH